MNNLEWLEDLKYKGERAVTREFNTSVMAEFNTRCVDTSTEVYSLEFKVKARRGRKEDIISMLKNHLYKDLIGDLHDLRSLIISGCDEMDALKMVEQIQRRYDR